MPASEQYNKDWYEVLEVSREATDSMIRRAYQRLSKIHHPDKCRDPAKKEETTTKFLAITQAYHILSDPKKRKVFDTHGNEGLTAVDAIIPYCDTADEVLRKYEDIRRAQRMGEQTGNATTRISTTGVWKPKIGCSNPWDALKRGKFVLPYLEALSMQRAASMGLTSTLFGKVQADLNAVGGDDPSTPLTLQDPRVTLSLIYSPETLPDPGDEKYTATVRIAHTEPWAEVRTKQRLSLHTVGEASMRYYASERSVLNWSLERQHLYLPWGITEGTVSATIDSDTKHAPLGVETNCVFRRDHHIFIPSLTAAASTMAGRLAYTFVALDSPWFPNKFQFFTEGQSHILPFPWDVQWKTTSLGLGVYHELDSYISARVGLSISPNGINLNPTFVYEGETLQFEFPIAGSWTDFVGIATGIGLVAGCSCLLAWVQGNRERRIADDEDAADADAKNSRISQDIKAAELAQNEMLSEYRRIKADQESMGGIVILSAEYGDLDHRNDTGGSGGRSNVLDVKIPVQCLVQNDCYLLISGERVDGKASLSGFYDPCVGVDKQLRVRYLFKGMRHAVTVDDFEELEMPLEAHCEE